MEDLDDRLRAAMKALDDRAPVRIDEDFAAKIEARLTGEAQMENVTTEGTGATADGVPPRQISDDSGLHDIKALAKTTRQRVQRISSQHDALRDDALLSASSSGLHMVALPQPANIVSLPSIDELAKAEPAIARAAEKVARESHGQPRRKPAVWIAGAVVAAAAAAVGIIVVKGNGAKDRAPAASSFAAGSGSAVGAATPVARDGERAEQEKTAVAAPPPQAAHGTGTPAEGTTGAAALDTGAMGSASGSGSASAAGSGSGATDTTTLPVKNVDEDRHQTKGKDKAPGGGKETDTGKLDKAKKDAGPTATNTKVKKNPNEPKSLDDLIDEAAGGPAGGGSKPKPVDTKPTIDKKELTPQDIRSAMGSAAKRAQACYDKFGQAGTVGVKASVAPSGSITKVTITGAFAGTPTGDCVASVVEGVSFPAWDGAPMTVNYSYLLTE